MQAINSKKGFIFTVLFTLMFALFLFTAEFYSENLAARKRSLSISEIDRAMFIVEDISSDISQIFGDLRTQRNETHTQIFFEETMPSDLENASKEWEEYSEFIEQKYSNTTGEQISLDWQEFVAQPQFFIGNCLLAFSDINKTDLILSKGENITHYKFEIYLEDSCLNGNCTNASEIKWNWAEEGDGVEILVQDGSERTVFWGSGFMNSSSENSISVKTETGQMNFSFGGDALVRIRTNSTAQVNLDLLFEGEPQISVPVGIDVGRIRTDKIEFPQ